MDNKPLLQIRDELAAPFKYEDYEWRVSQVYAKAQPSASVLCYITSRAAMDRLDEVMGIGAWKDRYQFLPQPDGSINIVCTLELKIDGEWVGKTDGAPQTNVEAFKGGISDAFKRACVKWGIGRLLYNLPNTYVDIKMNKPNGVDKSRIKYANDKKSGTKGYWVTPPMPKWAIATDAPIVKPPTTSESFKGGVYPAIKEGISTDHWAHILTTAGHKWNGKLLSEINHDLLSKVCFVEQKLETFNEIDRAHLEGLKPDLDTPQMVDKKAANEKKKKELLEQTKQLKEKA